MIKIYLVSLILILSAACFTTTVEIYKSFKNYTFLYLETKHNYEELLEVLQIHIKQKNWLACITKIEQKIKKEKNLPTECYNIIGYCYYSIEIYNLANYYYQQALQKNPNSMVTLLNLGEMYTVIKKYKEAYNIYNKINMIDSNNKIAQKKLKTLTKYL
uniref:Uncharacterized protein n=1 Tax=Hypnea pannosa TaxID=105607 RepID=A0A4D6WTS7_9FLOR|nr:hypothetical protein [Hypnea pannosa]